MNLDEVFRASVVVLMDIQNNVAHPPVLTLEFEDQHQPVYN
jgi:hypothetical protein